MLFSETARHPVFSATMSKHRFSFLYAVLSFDDPEEQRGLWGSDPFAAARELNVIFNDQMKSVLLPSEYLSIDETLYTMRLRSTSGSTIPINRQSTDCYTSL